MNIRKKPGKKTLAHKVYRAMVNNYKFYQNRKIAVDITANEMNVPLGFANNIFKKHILPELNENVG